MELKVMQIHSKFKPLLSNQFQLSVTQFLTIQLHFTVTSYLLGVVLEN